MTLQEERIKHLNLPNCKHIQDIRDIDLGQRISDGTIQQLVFQDPELQYLILNKQDYMELWNAIGSKHLSYRCLPTAREGVTVWSYTFKQPFGEITIIWSGK